MCQKNKELKDKFWKTNSRPETFVHLNPILLRCSDILLPNLPSERLRHHSISNAENMNLRACHFMNPRNLWQFYLCEACIDRQYSYSDDVTLGRKGKNFEMVVPFQFLLDVIFLRKSNLSRYYWITTNAHHFYTRHLQTKSTWEAITRWEHKIMWTFSSRSSTLSGLVRSLSSPARLE